MNHQGADSRERAQDPEPDHVREEVHPGDAFPVNARNRVGERERDDQDRQHEEPLRPDDSCERAASAARAVPDETPRHVGGEDEAHGRETERGQEERVPLHQSFADQFLDDLNVLLAGIHAVGRPHVVVHVQEEREGPEQRTDDDHAEHDAEVIDEQMSQSDGLREHPSDVQRRDGDDPELHASNADDQLRQVARREMDLLRPSDITCETHRTGHQQPRHENAAQSACFPTHA